jgi:hypothetical protein
MKKFEAVPREFAVRDRRIKPNALTQRLQRLYHPFPMKSPTA